MKNRFIDAIDFHDNPYTYQDHIPPEDSMNPWHMFQYQSWHQYRVFPGSSGSGSYKNESDPTILTHKIQNTHPKLTTNPKLHPLKKVIKINVLHTYMKMKY